MHFKIDLRNSNPVSKDISNDVSEVLEMSLWDFISNRNVSVRLQNCLEKANHRHKVPFETIQEYLLDGKSAAAKMSRLENLGRKTAYELDILINKWAEENEIIIEDKSSSCNVPNYLKDRTFCEIISTTIVSTRLKNAISKNVLPFGTVGEYLEAGADASRRLYAAPNVGRKTVTELIEILDDYIKDETDKKKFREKLAEEKREFLEGKDVFEIVENGYVSIEIKKKIEGFIQKSGKKSLSFYNYLIEDGRTLRSIGLSVSQMREVHECVKEVVPDANSESLLEIDEDRFLHMVRVRLSLREFGVLVRRMGLLGEEKHTLEELGEFYLITRERVRQIHMKTVSKLRESSCVDVARSFVRVNRNNIEKEIFHKSGFTNEDLSSQRAKALPPITMLAIEIGFEDIVGWLDYYYRKHENYWLLPTANLMNMPLFGLSCLSAEWKAKIRTKTESMAWPIHIDELVKVFPQLMNDEIIDFIKNELGAKIDNGYIVDLKKISHKARITYILRMAGRALHASEIRARIKEIFDVDISEHHVSSSLHAMDNALIVRRGYYDLYENLSLGQEDLSEIRGSAYSFLHSVGEYVSAKVIYRKLFHNSHERYGPDFTSYMLFGILQDDARFSMRRGLMIAIAGSGADAQFNSLTDEVITFVVENGPVRIGDVLTYIGDKRSVLNVSITTILNASEEVVASDVRGYYNSVKAVIGDSKKIAKLNDCIELCLFGGAKSLHYIKKELLLNEINLEKRTLGSWLNKLDEVSLENGIYCLVEPSQEISSYQLKFNLFRQEGLEGEKLREALCLEFDTQPEKRFIMLDCRLKQSVNDEHLNSSNPLNSILEEFNF